TSAHVFWSGWIFDELAVAHPDLAIGGDSSLDLQARLGEYIGKIRQTHPVLITFYDPGYSVPLFPPFNFQSMGVGWLPGPLTWRAVGPDEELSSTMLESVAKYYLRGEDGVGAYADWAARYGDSYEEGYLLARYMTGAVSTGKLLIQIARPDLALPLFERAIAVEPLMVANYPPAVQLAEQAGDYPKAAAYQGEIVARLRDASADADTAALLMWMGAQVEWARLLGHAGEVPHAQQLLGEVLRLKPDYAPAHAVQQQLGSPSEPSATLPQTPQGGS
ncbi:MAG: hypothetical protein ABI743_09720, partial [bacterium]